MSRKTLSLIVASICIVCAVFALLGNSPLVWAQSMTGSTYKIQSDSINLGGALGSSASYKVEDTLGEIATGDSSSASYKVRAGYQQMADVFIAMTAASDVAMSPDLGGVTGGTSNGSTVVTVTTDSGAGYTLSLKASSSPAMQGNTHGGTIADYTPAGANPDYTFSVPATTAEFGFSPEGTDIAQRYKNGPFSTCNTGSADAVDRCWDALTTSDRTISSRTSANTPSGTATTIKFRLTLGSSNITVADTYTATTTLTAIAL